MSVKLQIEEVSSQELQPGDLFSSAFPMYWTENRLKTSPAIGERVYIRTYTLSDEDVMVYRISVLKEEEL